MPDWAACLQTVVLPVVRDDGDITQFFVTALR